MIITEKNGPRFLGAILKVVSTLQKNAGASCGGERNCSVACVRMNHICKIKALPGVLARLPWGWRDMLGSMNGKHGGVYVKYVSLIVSCYWIKVFITAL